MVSNRSTTCDNTIAFGLCDATIIGVATLATGGTMLVPAAIGTLVGNVIGWNWLRPAFDQVSPEAFQPGRVQIIQEQAPRVVPAQQAPANLSQMEAQRIQDLREVFVDSISENPLTDPVIHSCGNTFERAEVIVWLNRRQGNGCPSCRGPMQVDDLRPNVMVADALEVLNRNY